MADVLKILVCGDVDGGLSTLFRRISVVEKKAGKFDMLFCVGTFCSKGSELGSDESQYLSGSIKVPLPVYILGVPTETEKQHLSSEDGADNIIFLGRRGVFSGASGLQVAYLSGKPGSKTQSESNAFTEDDIDSLLTQTDAENAFKKTDILLTSTWPENVTKYDTSNKISLLNLAQSFQISRLALQIEPRYHFSVSGSQFYERLPYRNHVVLSETAKPVTRFISLASVGNQEKNKWLYALNLTPRKLMTTAALCKQPDHVTECPYRISAADLSKHDELKRKEEDESNQFFFDRKALAEGRKRKQQSTDSSDSKLRRPMGPCWFCLGSPEVAKHLVVSVGTHCYLALPKGGLLLEHLLILPITHHQSVTSCPSEVLEEINKYKQALIRCFKDRNQKLVFFERNYKTSHLQIQVVPIPSAKIRSVKDAFCTVAANHNFTLNEIPSTTDLSQVLQPRKPYFFAELPTGDTLYYAITQPDFPLQFGREALCAPGVLNTPWLVDWKSCQLSRDEEIEAVQKMKQLFKPYDFSVDDDDSSDSE